MNANKIRFKNIINCFLGSIAEWYEFVVYGFCASFIGPLFFPSDHPTISILAAFGAFAAGFLARPVGALVFGHLGDKYSRKKAMAFSVVLIGLPALVMGLLPTYQTIGVLAPIILITSRLLQGLSIGGQFTGSAIFITEHIGNSRKNFGSGITFSGSFGGMLLASFVGAILTKFLTHEQLVHWGWRIPFILGIFVAMFGFYIKKHTTEPEAFEKLKKQRQLEKRPITAAFKTEKKSMLFCTLSCWLISTIVYQLFLLMPTYAQKYLNLPLQHSLRINTLAMILLTILTFFFGFLADYWGYKKFLFTGALFFIIFGFPSYYILSANPELLIYIQIIFAFWGAVIIGPLMNILSHAFARKTRYTALSFSYNLGFGIFGGSNALLMIFLIQKFEFIQIPGIYLSLAALVSTFALIPLVKHQYS